MIQRKQILQQTSILLKQNPGEAHLTTEELQQTNYSADIFLCKISRYLSNLTRSNSYWQKGKEDLKAIINHAGPPTFFVTFSSAEMHRLELHELFTTGNSNRAENMYHNVINNPHITDWFFTKCSENLSNAGCITHNMLIGTDIDLNIKLEVVFIVMVLLN